MRETEYQGWLKAEGSAVSTVSTRLSDARRVELHYGDLDAAYVEDGFKAILAALAYNKADEQAGRINPSAIPVTGSIYNSLASYRSAVTTYRRFLETADAPPPDVTLARDDILAAMKRCEQAGSTENFIASLPGLGQPRDYWLLDGGTRYPSKAIVRDALRAKGHDAEPGTRVCKQMLESLGFVVIHWPNMQSACATFMKRMPGFTTFHEQSGEYWRIEREYKDRIGAAVGEIVHSPMSDTEAGQAILRKLTLGERGLPLGWQTLDTLAKTEAPQRDAIFAALGKLARADGDAGAALEQAAQVLEAARDEGVKHLHAGSVLSTVISILGTMHPLLAAWFKITRMREAGTRLFGRKLFPSSTFQRAEFAEYQQIMLALFFLLGNEQGWEPDDLIDVQGFLWVALASDEEWYGDRMPTADLTLDHTPVWIVTARWDTEDGVQRFLDRGEWSLVNDTGSANNDRMRQMQPGDRIFMRDYFHQSQGLPFEANGARISAIRIRAVGTVTEQRGDGLSVGVDWETPLPEPRVWYFYTQNDPVWWLREPGESPLADRLRAFILHGAEQDYAYFLDQWFGGDDPSENGAAPLPSPTNLILYGPPGTGKTYTTAREAVRLCGEAVPEDRGALMALYHSLHRQGRIGFVTFHQNFAYEDFVEGLRPVTGGCDGGGFALEPQDGVFKQIASLAALPAAPASVPSHAGRGGPGLIADDTALFRMLLGDAADRRYDWVFDQSIAEGHALFSFVDVDWSDGRFDDPSEILAELRRRFPDKDYTAGSGTIESTHLFRNVVRNGDVIVVSKGKKLFRAIGIFEGDYEFAPRDTPGYSHRRKVRWLWHDREGLPVSILRDRQFGINTISRLPREGPNLAALDRLVGADDGAMDDAPVAQPHLKPLPHVLIIDEINRANISKVFGELITLLEADKRLGMPNALTVRLPYSKTEFGVPANLHVIGTMNTADRSIALLDIALRRRFTFHELTPDVTVPEFVDAERRTGLPLGRILTTINERIEYLVDREHRIGHAFFINCVTRADVGAVMRDKVIPLLQEYFFEDWSRIAAVVGPGFIGKRKLKPPPGITGDDIDSWYVRPAFADDAYASLLGGAEVVIDELAGDEAPQEGE